MRAGDKDDNHINKVANGMKLHIKHHEVNKVNTCNANMDKLD